MLASGYDVRPFSGAVQIYDLFVCTLGYEQRARFVAEQYVERSRASLALGFTSNHVLHYEDHRQWFIANGVTVVEGSDETCRVSLRDAIIDATTEAEHPRILIDISSMTRRRLAFTLWEVITSHCRPASVDFVYSVAEFSQPPPGPDMVAEFGPILSEFAGWPANPQQPMVLVLGLGYEADRALGAAELLEPADCWTFKPVGIDVRYDKTVEEANPGLAEILRGPEREITYRVEHPWETYRILRSLIDGITRDDRRRAIILPFGPKVFALLGLIVQTQLPSVGVWRVTAGPMQPVVDRVPNGTVIGLTLNRTA